MIGEIWKRVADYPTPGDKLYFTGGKLTYEFLYVHSVAHFGQVRRTNISSTSSLQSEECIPVYIWSDLVRLACTVEQAPPVVRVWDRDCDVPVSAARRAPIAGLVCQRCNDTHQMALEDRGVPCTFCPRPCHLCAVSEGRGAYCAITPCGCPCHPVGRKVR